MRFIIHILWDKREHFTLWHDIVMRCHWNVLLPVLSVYQITENVVGHPTNALWNHKTVIYFRSSFFFVSLFFSSFPMYNLWQWISFRRVTFFFFTFGWFGCRYSICCLQCLQCGLFFLCDYIPWIVRTHDIHIQMTQRVAYACSKKNGSVATIYLQRKSRCDALRAGKD